MMKVPRALFFPKSRGLFVNEDFPAKWSLAHFFRVTREPVVYRLPFMALNVQNLLN